MTLETLGYGHSSRPLQDSDDTLLCCRASEEGLNLKERKRRLCLSKLALLSSDESLSNASSLKELEGQLLLLEVQLSVMVCEALSDTK